MYFPLSLVNIVRFMIQGLGYSRLAILAGVCEMAARSLVGFCLVPVFGYGGACLANPAAWVAADLFLIPAYLHVRSLMPGADEEESAGNGQEETAEEKKKRKLLHALG
jgi:O-antigen/teichoic acid export membrane protein